LRNPPSRFLWEIPDDLIEEYKFKIDNNLFWNNFSFKEHSISSNTKIVKKVANNDVSQFNRWDKVVHPKFWNWLITTLNWEIADIAFSWVWIKKMNIRIAPVRKI
jgi:hypothetical protein